MCFKKHIHDIICNPFLERGHKHSEEGGMALRRGHFSNAKGLGLEKGKVGSLQKTAAESQREREIRAATPCRFMLIPIKLAHTEEAGHSCKCPEGWRFWGLHLGIWKDKLLTRKFCLSKSRVRLHSLPYACPGSAGQLQCPAWGIVFS